MCSRHQKRGDGMTSIRIAVVIESAMFVGGLCLLYLQFFVSRIIFGKVVLAGGFLAVVGALLLCEDFCLLLRKSNDRRS
jgi:hypothetical protein